ncbi:MAG: hemin ABC transporter substrate-binding protein [Sneathiella sp.]
MIRLISVIFLLFSTVALADAPKRVVSVGGALTETVYALGAGELIVGSDTTSYYPEAAAASPKVGYQRALSAEGILSLNPDFVLMTDEAGPPPVLAQLKSAGVNMLTLNAGRSLEDVKKNIEVISGALDRKEEGAALIADMTAAEAKLKDAIAGQGVSKRIMFILQHTGGAPMVAGMNTAADSIIKLAGAVNVVTGYEGYKPLSPEAATSLAPEILLVTSQGIEQAGGVESLFAVPGLSLTPAAKDKQVIVMDSLLLLGFGPRTADAALELNQKSNNL